MLAFLHNSQAYINGSSALELLLCSNLETKFFWDSFTRATKDGSPNSTKYPKYEVVPRTPSKHLMADMYTFSRSLIHLKLSHDSHSYKITDTPAASNTLNFT